MVNINDRLSLIALENLSDKELNTYCLINGDKNKTFDEFVSEISDNRDMYPLLASLSGKPLSYVLTKLTNTTFPYIPAGKKLNPRLVYAIECNLNTNKDATRSSALQDKVNEHVISSCKKVINAINGAFNIENDYRP